MSGKILAFSPRRGPESGWSNAELAEFYRVQDLLSKAGLALASDVGETDEGDPWLVFYRVDTGDVLAHFARDRGRFLAVSALSGEVIAGGNLRAIVDQLVRRQPLLLPPAGSAHGATLRMHPAAVLTAFVAAALLQGPGMPGGGQGVGVPAPGVRPPGPDGDEHGAGRKDAPPAAMAPPAPAPAGEDALDAWIAASLAASLAAAGLAGDDGGPRPAAPAGEAAPSAAPAVFLELALGLADLPADPAPAAASGPLAVPADVAPPGATGPAGPDPVVPATGPVAPGAAASGPTAGGGEGAGWDLPAPAPAGLPWLPAALLAEHAAPAPEPAAGLAPGAAPPAGAGALAPVVVMPALLPPETVQLLLGVPADPVLAPIGVAAAALDPAAAALLGVAAPDGGPAAGAVPAESPGGMLDRLLAYANDGTHLVDGSAALQAALASAAASAGTSLAGVERVVIFDDPGLPAPALHLGPAILLLQESLLPASVAAGLGQGAAETVATPGAGTLDLLGVVVPGLPAAPASGGGMLDQLLAFANDGTHLVAGPQLPAGALAAAAASAGTSLAGVERVVIFDDPGLPAPALHLGPAILLLQESLLPAPVAAGLGHGVAETVATPGSGTLALIGVVDLAHAPHAA